MNHDLNKAAQHTTGNDMTMGIVSQWVWVMDCKITTHSPVSYTPLDVYKRQSVHLHAGILVIVKRADCHAMTADLNLSLIHI